MAGIDIYHLENNIKHERTLLAKKMKRKIGNKPSILRGLLGLLPILGMTI